MPFRKPLTSITDLTEIINETTLHIRSMPDNARRNYVAEILRSIADSIELKYVDGITSFYWDGNANCHGTISINGDLQDFSFNLT